MNRSFLAYIGPPLGLGVIAGSALPVAAAFNPGLFIPAVLSIPVLGVSSVALGLLLGGREVSSFLRPGMVITGAWLGVVTGGMLSICIHAARTVNASLQRNHQHKLELMRCEAWAKSGRKLTIVIKRVNGETTTLTQPERECYAADGPDDQVTAFTTPAPQSGVLRLTEKTSDCRRGYQSLTCDLVLVRDDGSTVEKWSRHGAVKTESWRF